MTDDDLAALAAVIARWDIAGGIGSQGLARVILESDWLREHDAREWRKGWRAGWDDHG